MTPEGRESDAAEPRRARAERRRAAREEFEAKQLARVAEVVDEERAAFEKEVARRIRDESKSSPPGWTGEIAFGPGTTPETRRAIGGP